MTENRNLKQRVRDRAARTGESYSAARRHLVGEPEPVHGITVAAAQSRLRPDPGSRDELRASGAEVRDLMRRARSAGAELIHLGEGALTAPHKRILSSTGPDSIGVADWTRVDRLTMAAELETVRATAMELRLWTVVGSIYFSDSERPTNCLYVISPAGRIARRYDERMLSRTKARLMYAPGSKPLTFTVGGVTFGLALGMETQYPELFAAYEDLGAQCVLFSTAGNPDLPEVFAVEAAAHAAANSIWISYAGGLGQEHAASGIIAPTGRWESRCQLIDDPDVALARIDADRGQEARSWRRQARLRFARSAG